MINIGANPHLRSIHLRRNSSLTCQFRDQKACRIRHQKIGETCFRRYVLLIELADLHSTVYFLIVTRSDCINSFCQYHRSLHTPLHNLAAHSFRVFLHILLLPSLLIARRSPSLPSLSLSSLLLTEHRINEAARSGD